MTGLHSITSANIQIESIQSCMVGRWIALDNLSQIHFERNRASAIICSVDQKPLFRIFLAGPSKPGGLGGNALPPNFFDRSVNHTQPELREAFTHHITKGDFYSERAGELFSLAKILNFSSF